MMLDSDEDDERWRRTTMSKTKTSRTMSKTKTSKTKMAPTKMVRRRWLRRRWLRSRQDGRSAGRRRRRVRAGARAREAATRGRRLRRGLTEAMPESEFGTAPSAGTGGGDASGAIGRGALSVASLVAASRAAAPTTPRISPRISPRIQTSVRRSNPLAGASPAGPPGVQRFGSRGGAVAADRLGAGRAQSRVRRHR